MTGLEKILSQIENESNDRCRSITAQAEQKAEELINSAKAKAEEILAESSAQTAKTLENIKQSSESSAELNKSKIVLKSKLGVIDSMLERALAALKESPDAEYFEMLKTLLLNNAKDGEGVLVMSEKDNKRMPAGFLDEVNAKLEKGKTVTLGEPAELESGFVLVYGDIDINCTFDALAASKRDELRDTLNTLLFN
ncbi:MAG: hypothetical protein K6C14_02770 [Eubacterium sp.]|nr:hypothetical protein [Eubacterium sp.]